MEDLRRFASSGDVAVWANDNNGSFHFEVGHLLSYSVSLEHAEIMSSMFSREVEKAIAKRNGYIRQIYNNENGINE
jgi:hypothetical protein